jgi:ABC-type multidrug transport system fused ATPase/permease subunit
MRPEILKLIKEYVLNNRGKVFGSIFLSYISQFIDALIIPERLADIFTNMGDFVILKRKIYIFLATILFDKTVYMAGSYLSDKIEPTLSAFITKELVKAVFTKYESTHKPIDVAISMEKIGAIRSALEDLIQYICFKLIPSCLVLIVGLIRITMLNKKLGVAIIVSVIILFTIIIMLPKPLNTIKQKDRLYIYIEDIFKNIELISSTNNGIKTAYADIMEKSESLYKNREKSIKTTGINQSVGYLISFGLYSAVILYLYKLYKDKEIDIKQFETFLLTIGKLFEIVYNLAWYIPGFVRNLQRIDSASDFLHELFSYKEKKGIKCDIKDFNMIFNNVTVKYGKNVILKNFSTAIDKGKIIALFGASGSGKSTFANCILDIVSPCKGSVNVGNHKISKLSKCTIRKYISCVQQNTTSLLTDTIYNNITYGCKKTPELRSYVEHICAKYNIYSIFGGKFLDRNCGKSGIELSGGQRQLVHIMHCMVNKTSQIIVLDEPTAALDANSKCKIIRLIKHLHLKGKTIFIITHDDVVKKIANRVYNFAKGSNPTCTDQ